MNITAEVVAHSRRKLLGMQSDICTLVVEMPLMIWAQMLTHRDFSRNGQSARAVPISALIQQTIDNKVTPIYWGANKSGMQANSEIPKELHAAANKIWREGALNARRTARKLDKLNLHKQIANRPLAPYQHIRVIITSTEWDNFYVLRKHKDAQPEIQAVADAMHTAMCGSTPRVLRRGEWHLPFIKTKRIGSQTLYYSGSEQVTLGQAKKISASMCAQISFRAGDDNIKKALTIFSKLATSTPIHASPFEHQAKAKILPFARCRNLVGWHQYRVDVERHFVPRASILKRIKKRVKWVGV